MQTTLWNACSRMDLQGSITKGSSLVQVLTWRRQGNTLQNVLPEPMMIRNFDAICVNKPQCVDKNTHLTTSNRIVHPIHLPENIRGHWNHILTHLPLDKMAFTLAGDNVKCIFVNESDRIPIRFSVKFVPRSTIDNKPALVQVMAWWQAGAKPLPNQYWSNLLTHICGTRGT